MCQTFLLSSTADYQHQGELLCDLTMHVSRAKIWELIFHSPEINIRVSSHLFLPPSLSLLQPGIQPALQTQHRGEEPLCRFSYLEAVEICWFEVIGGAATPVHNVLVLALAAQLPVPVGDAQVVVHHGVTEGAVLQHGVKEGLQQTQSTPPHLAPQTSFFSFTSPHGPKPNAGIFIWNDRINKLYCSATYETHSVPVFHRAWKNLNTLQTQPNCKNTQLRSCSKNLAQNNCTSTMTSLGCWQPKVLQERHQCQQ